MIKGVLCGSIFLQSIFSWSSITILYNGRKEEEFFLASSPIEGISLKSLADSLSLVLQTVKENSTTLNELNVNFKGLDQRISKIEESVLESKLEVEGIKPKVISLEVETNDLKSHSFCAG